MPKKAKYSYMHAPRAASVFDLLPARVQGSIQPANVAITTSASTPRSDITMVQGSIQPGDGGKYDLRCECAEQEDCSVICPTQRGQREQLVHLGCFLP